MFFYPPLASIVTVDGVEVQDGLNPENGVITQPQADFTFRVSMGGVVLATGSIDKGGIFGFNVVPFTDYMDYFTMLRLRQQEGTKGPFDCTFGNPVHGFEDQHLKCVFIESPRGISGGMELDDSVFMLRSGKFVPDYRALQGGGVGASGGLPSLGTG